MVQAIANSADIEGTVLAVEPDDRRPGHNLVTIDVAASTPVAGYPNLFASGEKLDVIVPDDVNVKTGTTVRLRVQRAGPATVFGFAPAER
jgi:hypothetical protein